MGKTRWEYCRWGCKSVHVPWPTANITYLGPPWSQQSVWISPYSTWSDMGALEGGRETMYVVASLTAHTALYTYTIWEVLRYTCIWQYKRYSQSYKESKTLIFLPASQPASPKVTLCFLCLFICILVCASAILTCPIITLHTLLPCDVTLVNLTAALCTSTTTSCLAQLQVRDINAQKQRQHRPNDARLTKSGNPKSKQLLIMSTQPQSH